MYALTRFSLEHSKPALAVLVFVTALLGSGLPRLQHAYGYPAIVGLDHPVIATLQDMVDQFGGGIPARIRWACGDSLPCSNVFDPASLEMAAAVASQLAVVDGVRDVYGISNTGLLVPGKDGFSIRHFVDEDGPVATSDELARIAASDPMWAGSLISPDLLAGTLFVIADASDHHTELAVVSAIEDALAPFRARGFEFYVVGGPVDSVVAGRDLSESSSRIIPFTVLFTALALFALCRSWQHVAVSLGAMGVAMIWTFGMLAWLGWPQDGILEVLAPLIMVVGVCDAVHLLSRYTELEFELEFERDPRSTSHAARLLEAAREISGPCVITTATTGAAFLSFTASDLASFQRFGTIAAFGVVACLVMTFSLLPILSDLLPQPRPLGDASPRSQRAWNATLDTLVHLAERRTASVLVASGILFVLGGLGWFLHLRVDTDWAESLGEDSSIVSAKRFEERHHFATNELEIELTLPSELHLESPDTLRMIQAFEREAAAHPLVFQTKSLLDLISHVNRLLHDDEASFERIADSRAANAEILELIAFDNPDMLSVWLNLDRTRLRITTHNREGSAQDQGALLRSIRRLAGDHLGPRWGVRLSGDTAVEYHWTNDVQMTQVRSFPIALALVFAIVAVFLRSPALALAAMIPAVLPIVVTLGAMGWAGMSLDMGRAMIAAIVLGIAVDDSIHMLSHYRVRRRAGDDPAMAIRRALRQVGRAIVTTSLSLSLGFLTLTASAWQSISSFGLFVSLSIVAALVAALVVLPAVVIACASIPLRRHSQQRHSQYDSTAEPTAAPRAERVARHLN